MAATRGSLTVAAGASIDQSGPARPAAGIARLGFSFSATRPKNDVEQGVSFALPLST
jgi:hypothetical protein